MKYLPSNTLAYFNAAPQVKRYDLSKIPTLVFGTATLKYRESCGEVLPDTEAITFYALNHCASIVRKMFSANEPLPAWAQAIMEWYTTVTAAQGHRMLHYILSITTREMRHLKANLELPVFWSKMEQSFGTKAVAAIKNIASDGDEFTAVDKYMKTPPEIAVAQYTGALSYGFHKGKWSGSFGGHPWGQVTDAVHAMLTGGTSMEMLVDTGYTLAHNGGPIFNKGMMYHHYSHNFITLLDLQRAGQIPDLILDTHSGINIQKSDKAVEAVKLIHASLPGEFKGYVDWHAVDASLPLGEKGKYASYQASQKGKSVKKPVVKKPVAPMAAATEPPVVMTIDGQKVKEIGEYMVWPGVTVPKYERVVSA